MNDEVSAKTVRLAFEATKLSGKVFCKAISAYLKLVKTSKNAEKHGKQTVKQLIRQGQGATTVEVSGGSVGAFKRVADKYGMDFAIKKMNGTDTPKYTVFFKAKDLDAMTAVVNEYSGRLMKVSKEKKPSLLKELALIKAELAKNAKKITEKVKEPER